MNSFSRPFPRAQEITEQTTCEDRSMLQSINLNADLRIINDPSDAQQLCPALKEKILLYQVMQHHMLPPSYT